jgi:hypothetical protein
MAASDELTYEPGCLLWYGEGGTKNMCAVLLGYRALVTTVNGTHCHMIMCLSDWLIGKIAHGDKGPIHVINPCDRDKNYIDRIVSARSQMLRRQALSHEFVREELAEK